MSFTIRKLREDKKPSKLRLWLRVIIPMIRSTLRLEQHLKEARVKDGEKSTREKRLRKGMTILVASLFVVILIIVTLKTVVRLKEIAIGMATVVSAHLPADTHGLTNILLLGEGDNNHEGIDLTDTIMIASLDPSKTKSAVLMSIPRDTYVIKTDKMGKDRINSLYRNYKNTLIHKGIEKKEASKQSMHQLAKEISTLVGIEIHGVVKVNFSGFEKMVDLLGGVDVDVPEDLIDTEYPGPNYSYETFSLKKGMQHLDGATALKYARSRHSTSDFSRSARQQQIITALAKKAQEEGLMKNISRMSEMLEIVSENVESTFSNRELLGLAVMGKSIHTQRIINVQLNDQNGLFGSLIQPGGFLYAPPREQFDGAAVLLPYSIPEFPITWKQVQTLSSLIFTKRAIFLMPPSIVALNAGAKEGSARVLGGELYRYLFNVIKTRNLGPRGSKEYNESFIAVNPRLLESTDALEVSRGKIATSVATMLSTTLKMKVEEHPDAVVFLQENPDIAIVLGKDFRYTALQDLLSVE